MPKNSTFLKTFVYDFAKDIDYIVNAYAEEKGLEIRSISICHNHRPSDCFIATVVFERSAER